MTGRRLFLVGLLAFLLFTAFRLPASLVVPGMMPPELRYSAAEGTVWNGTLRRASLGPRALGDVAFSLNPLALLTGTPSADIKLSGGDAQGRFKWQYECDLYISSLDLVVDIKARLGSQVLAGALRLTDGGFGFAPNGQCTDGTAQVRTNILELALGQAGPILVGNIACRGGVLAISLAGKAQTMAVKIDGNLGGKAGQSLRLSLTPDAGADIPEELERALTLSGFSREAGGAMVAHLELDVFL